MSGLIGKKNSTLKKQSVKESKALATGVRGLKFWHEATAPETSIPFGSLTLPSAILASGLTNPTSTEIISANLAFFSANVEVTSSVNGKLMEGLTYVVRNSQIKFINGYESIAGEIFEVESKNNVVTGTNIVDARPLSATGVLTTGNTEFNVGEAFKTNAYPSAQIGEVAVYVDGLLQFRNVGNATAAPAADGNYQEIASSGGFGSVIKFNEAFGTDVNVHVISRNLIAERPDISMMQYIETLAGQVDSMVPTVAALAGVPETDFQSAPNNVDLKAFGDKLNSILNAEVPIQTEWEYINPFAGALGAISQGFGSPTQINIRTRRDGTDLLIQGSFLCGTPTGDEARIAFSDTLTSLNSIEGVEVVGQYGQVTAVNQTLLGIVSAGVSYVNHANTAGLGGFTGIQNGTDDYSVGEKLSINVRIPIEGWEATQTLKQQLG